MKFQVGQKIKSKKTGEVKVLTAFNGRRFTVTGQYGYILLSEKTLSKHYEVIYEIA